ncbi:mediator of RNA polymerase II transcription subunit 20-like [Lingula anatina]|uniref:Mediator of RNA polymerase II transcription subunit 20 n=1 Tax=Lingula anatina TaxID=7574 RepID=A0A1S3JSI3_LINAN|nr:mediator of RNA polymerase II transcription subunit 20-like [Lingula anatina]XP_013412979.1 mediator of RNA polymerase II transcription subunit 20-like [Lingula anatina]|eukprot:XP_013395333.1 mediator of RNA polymerase II transcription subunit 20-like [Lingula anatina]
MGVVCVASYPVPEGKSGQQIVDVLQSRLEQLGAEKSGQFNVDCETYQSQVPSAQNRLVHLLHNSEQPATCFAVLDTGTCLVADNLFNLLMLKLKNFYPTRKGFKIESKGQRYSLGDFIIKIGSVTFGQNISFKGILVEVEYCPCMVPGDCWDLMKEFMQGFMGNCVENPSNYLKTKMDIMYTPADTIQQYLEHFKTFRKESLAVTR